MREQLLGDLITACAIGILLDEADHVDLGDVLTKEQFEALEKAARTFENAEGIDRTETAIELLHAAVERVSQGVEALG